MGTSWLNSTEGKGGVVPVRGRGNLQFHDEPSSQLTESRTQGDVGYGNHWENIVHVDAGMQTRWNVVGNVNLENANHHEMGQEVVEEEDVNIGLAFNRNFYM